MPRARKPRQDATSDPVQAEDENDRPSQLDAIRQVLSKPPRDLSEGEAAPELPAAEASEAPELPAAEEPAELPPATADEPAPDVAADAAPAEPADAPSVVEVPGVAEAPAQPVISPWVPPPTTPPSAARTPVPAHRGGAASSSLAVGIVLVVVGVFFLLIRLLDIDLSTYGWPLYVIIPGLTLLVVGFISLGSGALIPGGIVLVTGLVLAYQSATEDWASWAYAWALVAPGGVGLGIFLQGLRVRDPRLLRQGRSLMFWAVLIFLIGFVLFESILNVSGHDYGKVGQAALPVLLIIIGVTLLVRNFRRGRSA